MWRADGPLTADDVHGFVRDGFVAVRGALGDGLADRIRSELWARLDESPDDPSTWTEPSVRLGSLLAPSFGAVLGSPALVGAYDQLVGPGRWRAELGGSGTVVVRFPIATEPTDTGWHADAGYVRGSDLRLDVASTGRSLLLLVLLSDVGPDDAPTRLAAGSHRDVVPVLATAGTEGRSFLDVVPQVAGLADRTVVEATGAAGDVFVCHPFLLHKAEAHREADPMRAPRFLAQPGTTWAEGWALDPTRPAAERSPLEQPVADALGLA